MKGRHQNTTHNYNEENFWRKISRNALQAGKEVIEKALILYYATQSEDVPVWAKTIIFSSLAYFIFPADMIPDITPAVGYTDDLFSLLSAFSMVYMHITTEHKKAAAAKLKEIFGNNEA
ncbi:MAG: YkvA family protein [Rivularia sp. (in: cyanobacteria)]